MKYDEEDPFTNFLIKKTSQQFSVLAKKLFFFCKGNVFRSIFSRKEQENIKSTEDPKRDVLSQG